MTKEITVIALINILEKLKFDDVVYCNGVGNLTVVRDKKYYGFIDFLEGKLEKEE